MAVLLDHRYKEELTERLRKLDADTVPQWGKMTPDDLIPHFAFVIRYSMGEGKPTRFKKSFVRTIAKPFVFAGLLKLPKNVRVNVPDYSEETVRTPDDLSALLDEYLAAAETGALETNPHPAFGDIGVDGWARFHIIHFEHHMTQFGL